MTTQCGMASKNFVEIVPSAFGYVAYPSFGLQNRKKRCGTWDSWKMYVQKWYICIYTSKSFHCNQIQIFFSFLLTLNQGQTTLDNALFCLSLSQRVWGNRDAMDWTPKKAPGEAEDDRAGDVEGGQHQRPPQTATRAKFFFFRGSIHRIAIAPTTAERERGRAKHRRAFVQYLWKHFRATWNLKFWIQICEKWCISIYIWIYHYVLKNLVPSHLSFTFAAQKMGMTRTRRRSAQIQQRTIFSAIPHWVVMIPLTRSRR